MIPESSHKGMSEASHRYWDTVLKWIAVVGALISFLWGVNQYVTAQAAVMEAERIARDRLFAVELFTRRMDEYEVIAAAAGRLSEPDPDPTVLANDIRAFERLYWTSLASLESTALVTSMDYLRSGIDNYRKGRIMVGHQDPEDQLRVRARMLTRKIRSSINMERQALTRVVPLPTSEKPLP